MQTEKQAYAANAKEWAHSLTGDEISRLLTERRSTLRQFEIKALVNEERSRAD